MKILFKTSLILTFLGFAYSVIGYFVLLPGVLLSNAYSILFIEILLIGLLIRKTFLFLNKKNNVLVSEYISFVILGLLGVTSLNFYFVKTQSYEFWHFLEYVFYLLLIVVLVILALNKYDFRKNALSFLLKYKLINIVSLFCLIMMLFPFSQVRYIELKYVDSYYSKKVGEYVISFRCLHHNLYLNELSSEGKHEKAVLFSKEFEVDNCNDYKDYFSK